MGVTIGLQEGWDAHYFLLYPNKIDKINKKVQKVVAFIVNVVYH